MERDTKTIVTPVDKVEIVLKAWITGGERRKISGILLEGSSIKSNELESMSMSADIVNKVQDATFEEVIVSISGKTDEIAKTVLEMKTRDFDFVVEEINKITGGEEVKKN